MEYLIGDIKRDRQCTKVFKSDLCLSDIRVLGLKDLDQDIFKESTKRLLWVANLDF